MNKLNKRLQIEQLDKKLEKLRPLRDIGVPSRGWIHAIRTTMNMSLVQLARRLGKTPVSVKEIEEREESKGITLKKLTEIGEALDLQLVYGFIPKELSIRNMIDRQALRIAHDVVMRTSHTMKLEDQENSEERLRQAIRERSEEIQREMPKYLWD